MGCSIEAAVSRFTNRFGKNKDVLPDKRMGNSTNSVAPLNLPEGFTPAPSLYERPLGPVPQVRYLYDFGDPPKPKKKTSRDMDGY